MLKKSITYKNIDGVSVTDEFHFNLTKAELIELEMSEEGGLRQQLEKMMMEKDRRKIIAFIKNVIKISVGRRIGDVFVKSDEITNSFMGTEAYSELFVEMLQNPGDQAKFVAGIMPQELVSQVDVEAITREAFAKHGVEYPAKEVEQVKDPKKYDPSVDDVTPDQPKTLEDYTNEELVEMPIKQFHALLESNKGKLPKRVIVLAMQRANETE